ncbi:MAG: anti-sigma factor family protein [Planctomycetota bacterium]|jgi:anti-sigma factor RsiW
MNMTHEMLEILIGKYLDGEITPSEQRMLEAALEEDSKARELLEQLQDLHQSSREAIASEVLERGKTPEQIFEQAWQQQAKYHLHPMIKIGGYIRFAAGVAAGFALGLALHFILPAVSTRQSDTIPPVTASQKAVNEKIAERPAYPRLLLDPADNVIRNVDWYSFTDKQGNQWLIEGLRENIVRPAVYDEGL